MFPFNPIQMLSRFRRRRDGSSGNVSVMAALVFIPAIGLTGLSVDYGVALKTKFQLNAAADAASLAAISQAQANPGSSTIVSDATAVAKTVFATNAGAANDYLAQPLTVSVAKSGRVYTAAVTYKANRPTYFGAILNGGDLTLNGSSTATVTLPSYLDFYLLLDVSGSMGIASTVAGQTSLSAINPDQTDQYPGGCAFACHFTPAMCDNPRGGAAVVCQGFNLSRTNGTGTRVANDYCAQPGLSTCIQLRIDAVAYAVQQLLAKAQASETLTNQFRVGLYPFIVHMQSYEPITTDLTTVSTKAAGLPDLLDTGSGTNRAGQLGSGGTHFENALPEMQSTIATIGDGSSASHPLPFVFLVTDGAQDNQYYLSSGGWTGSNHDTTLNTANCTALKTAGITVSVLYVPYVAIQNVNTSFAGDEDDYANWNIPHIPPVLQACASPGFFFTANAPSDITAAMQAMFAQAVQTARLIQ